LTSIRPLACRRLLSFLAFSVLGATATSTAEQSSLHIQSWLLLDPTPTPLPAFHDHKDGSFVSKTLLALDTLDPRHIAPREGASVRFPSGKSSGWRSMKTNDSRLLVSPPTDATTPEIAYAAVYISCDRFLKTKLILESEHLLRAWIDGRQVLEKTSAAAVLKNGKKDSTSHEVNAELALTQGTHSLVIAMVRAPKSRPRWTLRARLVVDDSLGTGHLSASTQPTRSLSLRDLLDGRSVADIDISSDGALVALRYRDPGIGGNSSSGWFEIRRVRDGALVRTIRGDSVYSSFAWSPRGRRFSYTTTNGTKRTLWLGDLDAASSRPIIENVDKLGAHRWSPNGKTIVYSVVESAKKSDPEKSGVQRMRGLPDRWPDNRNRQRLFQVDVDSGSRRQLTAGAPSASLHDISPDGRRLIFGTSHYHYDARPYSTATLWELDLDTLAAREITSGPWLGSAEYGPEGERLLVLGSPRGFGDVGVNVEQGQISNDYDTQAFIVDRHTGAATPITLSFDPEIAGAAWSHDDGNIYLRASEASYVRLYRFDPRRSKFTRLASSVDVVSGFSLARGAARLVYRGTSVTHPVKVFGLDLDGDSGTSRQLSDPNAERFADIRLGKIESWSFATTSGTTITGRVHYPPEFDATRKYPLIVYYYGGTSPTPRDFGGRYPKNFWAARGYVVYVLQPSGATGFGQSFSARHVNNWGKTVAAEIIEGLKGFLGQHDFIDAARVGCIGASYGGFMTMNLITKTDRFAAAISHAGISSLSSYWGEGSWGYLYNSVAAANSFPWNRQDLYVDESALFRADKITTPLLLLHGTADTNVPPGESEQMYTAMKILGKEVEYVRFEGEGHWILERKKREIWSETIVAWFDKQLKGETEGWEHLYPARPSEEGTSTERTAER
jgi:dipeptidyl aminopeptidase/acylaminoacyl peptidase